MLLDERELTEQAAKIGTLLEDLESIPDPALRAKAAGVVQGLLALYGEGLARMVTMIRQRGGVTAGTAILEALAADELVSHLLLLHDAHPIDVETRVARALEEVRPYLQSHGGNVELIGVDGGVARLRLQGSCHGCPSSTMTLQLAIEEAIRKAAPDLDDIEADGVAAPPAPPVAFVPISSLRRTTPPMTPQPADEPPAKKGTWTTVGRLSQLVGGGVTAMEIAGRPALFVKLDGAVYAYHDLCPGCGQPLEQGALHGAELTCPTCQHCYDIRRAGRGVDAPNLYLEPIPLLVHGDLVTVASGPPGPVSV